MMTVGVDCIFSANGTVRVRRVQMGDKWLSVGQGRQWLDKYGRHILIMLPRDEVRELILRPNTMVWEMARGASDIKMV